jgi:hypothetical protein
MMEKIKIELVSITDYALSKRKARNTKLDDINNIPNNTNSMRPLHNQHAAKGFSFFWF